MMNGMALAAAILSVCGLGAAAFAPLPGCNATQMGSAPNPINTSRCALGCPELPQCVSVTEGGQASPPTPTQISHPHSTTNTPLALSNGHPCARSLGFAGVLASPSTLTTRARACALPPFSRSLALSHSCCRVCRPNCAHPQFPPSDRRLLAWVGGDIDNPANRDKFGGMAAVVAQLRANPGLFTGLMGFCGWAFDPAGALYTKNVTKYGQCAGTVNATTTPIPGGADLFAEVKRQQIEFQPVIGTSSVHVHL